MATNSIVDYLKGQGQDSSFAARTNLAKSKGISNYTGTADQNMQLLNTLRNQSTPTAQNSGSLANTLLEQQPTSQTLPTIQPEQPITQPAEQRTLPQNVNRPGSIAAMQDVLSNISKTVYSKAPTVSDLLQSYSNNGLNINNPNLISNIATSDTTSRAGAVQDLYNSSLNKAKEDQIQREKLFQNIAPSIYQELQDNPGVSTTDVIKKYADQYGVDPLEISGNLINYKSDQDKQNLLNAKSTIDILQSTGNSGSVNVPGLGKVDIKPSKKGDYSTVSAGGKLFVFDKDTGSVTPTGLSTDQLTLDNITGLIKDLGNPEVTQSFLKAQGVNLGVGTAKISNQSGLDAFKKSITNQESGNYKAVNKDSGALGAYQIMPFHLSKVGLTDSPADRQKFLNSPQLQDKLFNIIITNLGNQYNGDAAKMAAAYYGGGGAVSKLGTPAGDVPQGKYPSINSYVNSVLGRLPQQTVSNQTQSNTSQYGKAKDDKYFTLANKLSDDYRAESKDYLTIRNAYQNVQAIPSNTTNPQDDISLIFSFMKVVDPTSVVRESEFNTAAKASSLLDQFNIKVGKVATGQILNSTVRDNIKKSVASRFNNADKNQKLVVDTYAKRAQQAKIDPADVVVDYGSTVNNGTIRVKEKSSGRTGTISANEFNPNLYEKL